MKIVTIFLALQILVVTGQTWVSRARLTDFDPYFKNVMQEVLYGMERREWSNLKLQNVTSVINEHMYEWHVAGNVTYANGFVISIQRIDLTRIESLFTSRNVTGIMQASGTVRGIINFRDVKVGHDVIFEQADGSVHRYTGVFTYLLVAFQCLISRNYHTQEMITEVTMTSLSPGTPRMTYMPANNITEVLSRRFSPASNGNSVRTWGQEVIKPIFHELVTTKIEFPSICFINC